MLNKGNRVPNQLHEGIIKGKFPSRISDFPCKRNIFLNMSSNLNRPFDMAVIVEKNAGIPCKVPCAKPPEDTLEKDKSRADTNYPPEINQHPDWSG